MKRIVLTREEFAKKAKGRAPLIEQSTRSVPRSVGKHAELRVALLQRYTLVLNKTEYVCDEIFVAEGDGTLDMTQFLFQPLTLQSLADRVAELEAQMARLTAPPWEKRKQRTS